TDLEHAPAGQVDPAEVLVLVAPQVPGPGHLGAVAQADRVVEGAVVQGQVSTLVGQGALVLVGQLAEVALGRERRPEHAEGGTPLRWLLVAPLWSPRTCLRALALCAPTERRHASCGLLDVERPSVWSGWRD